MGIRAVSFDLGHTLTFPRYDWYSSILKGVGVEVVREDLEKMESSLRQWFDELVLIDGLHDGLWEKYFRKFFMDLGVAEGYVDGILLALYREHSSGAGLWTVPAPGAESVLERLSESSLQVACVSNNDGRLKAMVEHLGWQEHFDLLVDSEIVGFTKPDPRIFEHTLSELSRQSDEVIHVGDYYSIDVIGARRAGIEGILYDPLKSYKSVDCRVISKLEEIVEMVAE